VGKADGLTLMGLVVIVMLRAVRTAYVRIRSPKIGGPNLIVTEENKNISDSLYAIKLKTCEKK